MRYDLATNMVYAAPYVQALPLHNGLNLRLFAAGEVTGSVRGTNRLGANADAAACTYGFIAGTLAAAGEMLNLRRLNKDAIMRCVVLPQPEGPGSKLFNACGQLSEIIRTLFIYSQFMVDIITRRKLDKRRPMRYTHEKLSREGGAVERINMMRMGMRMRGPALEAGGRRAQYGSNL